MQTINAIFLILLLFRRVKHKSVRNYAYSSVILGRRKPLIIDEQIESHAESYIYPEKCAVEELPSLAHYEG